MKARRIGCSAFVAVAACCIGGTGCGTVGGVLGGVAAKMTGGVVTDVAAGEIPAEGLTFVRGDSALTPPCWIEGEFDVAKTMDALGSPQKWKGRTRGILVLNGKLLETE